MALPLLRPRLRGRDRGDHARQAVRRREPARVVARATARRRLQGGRQGRGRLVPGERGRGTVRQCGTCSRWTARPARRARAAGEGADERYERLCLKCEKAAAAAAAGDADDADGKVTGATKRKALAPQQQAALQSLLPVEGEVGGTLANKRVFVAESQLGAASGLGLYAGVRFKAGDVITSYARPILYRDEAEALQDTSYVLRIPNSGGAVIDGKPCADAIRANATNPGAWRRYYPCEGASEVATARRRWRTTRATNGCTTRGSSSSGGKARTGRSPSSRRCAPSSTRRARWSGEEIYYNYGSDKPFEKFRKEMHKRQVELQRRERDVCRSVWVPSAGTAERPPR